MLRRGVGWGGPGPHPADFLQGHGRQPIGWPGMHSAYTDPSPRATCGTKDGESTWADRDTEAVAGAEAILGAARGTQYPESSQCPPCLRLEEQGPGGLDGPGVAAVPSFPVLHCPRARAFAHRGCKEGHFKWRHCVRQPELDKPPGRDWQNMPSAGPGAGA